MIIEELRLANYRNFENLHVDLDDKLTVLVGDNGAGKTSILEALAVSLGSLFLNIDNIPTRSIKATDARIVEVEDMGYESQYPVEVWTRGEVDGRDMSWMRALQGAGGSTTYKEARSMYDMSKELQDRIRKGDSTLRLPIVAYYGTGRLWDNHKEKKGDIDWKSRTDGYRDSLDGTANLKLMNKWFSTNTVDKYQRLESGLPVLPYLDTVLNAMAICIEGISGYHDVKVIYELKSESFSAIYTDCNGKRIKLSLASMSAGYKNTMSLIADIAYRMAVLNPQLGDDILSSPGVVLIDEVDLHLHPMWQSRILSDLRRIFPNVQFIVSTHAPKVINSVLKKNIRIVSDTAAENVDEETYGRDSNSILEQFMHVNSRTDDVVAIVGKLESSLDSSDFKKAEELLSELEDMVSSSDALVTVYENKLAMKKWRGRRNEVH